IRLRFGCGSAALCNGAVSSCVFQSFSGRRLLSGKFEMNDDPMSSGKLTISSMVEYFDFENANWLMRNLQNRRDSSIEEIVNFPLFIGSSFICYLARGLEYPSRTALV